jgi:hypothetical protein
MCNPVTTSNPDALLAKGAHAGFEWEVTANGIGYRCGYVRLPQGHPWHGKDYDDEALWGVRVHGGLTFAAPDTHCGKGGEDGGYWLGFDCAHAGDAPDGSLRGQDSREVADLYGMFDGSFSRFGTVKTTEYVAAECRRLAEQAANELVPGSWPTEDQ